MVLVSMQPYSVHRRFATFAVLKRPLSPFVPVSLLVEEEQLTARAKYSVGCCRAEES